MLPERAQKFISIFELSLYSPCRGIWEAIARSAICKEVTRFKGSSWAMVHYFPEEWGNKQVSHGLIQKYFDS